ncbi:type II toxin-antitoxin system HicB family antitoxin [Moritella viscosa]|uniref:type II toxin-antitoxin system HicB family antitoxin n=1 Tax=Moritella viscosa TaxID=80854 RepID=UPI00091898F4|nr:type II toxin-antitoxin system HicB family antitoxin [Moritella viscosa]SGZ09088.1 Putative uncharacterized protein [Moritella viscosa]
MLFMIGIENPKNENEAYGMIVPAFEQIGYGCISAADEKKDIFSQAKLAILDMAEEAYKDGHLLSALDVGYTEHSKDYPDFDQWVALDVPVESIKAKQKRINITMSEFQLSRVDAFVETHRDYADRSDFLAKAADSLMQHQ